MSGNVWEWCYDWYDKYPRFSINDPTGPVSGVEHVIRGGCFQSNAYNRGIGLCRSLTRGSRSSATKSHEIGRRLAAF